MKKEQNKNNHKITDNIYCYAPYRSVYFDFYGQAFPCCENRKYYYGKYPKDSLNDIWFGNKIRRFRTLMKRKKLHKGCATCRYYLKKGSPESMKAWYYGFFPQHETYPTKIEFQLANTCNLECFMCDGESSSMLRTASLKLPPLSNPYDDDFIKQLEDYIPHLKQAHFVGGEPFMIPVFYKIWKKIIEVNPKCLLIVQTNATILNDEIESLIEKGRFLFNISLDTVDKEKYEKIRINANFEKTMKNIHYFIDYCNRNNTELTITACPMQQNWKTLPDLVNFSNTNNVKLFFHTVYYPQKASLFGMPNRELKIIHKVLTSIYLPENSEIEKENLRNYNALLLQIEKLYTKRSLKLKYALKEKRKNIKLNIRRHFSFLSA
ncbi:MAG: radical SAM protein [Bacteroidales bacterium]|jgi:radical SAM protein with 4Fe4S-binding SPASM domain|nr:radical SAM protein [Bacteroidales bacterium]MDD4215153.1 radical SAM protein [Bacteroidales bacterium]